MSFTYTKKLTGDIKPLIVKAQRVAKATGTTLTGDENSGKFHGNTFLGEIGGSYTVKDGVMHIAINKRPYLVSKAKLVAAFDVFFS